MVLSASLLIAALEKPACIVLLALGMEILEKVFVKPAHMGIVFGLTSSYYASRR